MMNMSIYYIDRETNEVRKEIVAGEKFLRWINETKTGNRLLETFVKRKVFSTLYGKFQDLSFSKRKISNYIEELQIDIKEAEEENISSYKNFNEFFSRKLKKNSRPIQKDNNIFISPADGRLLAYDKIDINSLVQVKGSYYSLVELFQDESLAKEYKNGSCIIVRLNPSDYHRFHFPDGGVAHEFKPIKGFFYSVNPMTLEKVIGVYCQNKREITIFNSDNFEKLVLVEVGATCVGSIIQTYDASQHINKGDEKGYFKFGGSTVIMFIKDGILKIDKDLLDNTLKGYETKVKMGEAIGRK